MFDAVLEGSGPRRPIGRSAIVSIGVHALLLAGALYLSSRAHDDKPKIDRVVTFFNPPPPPPPPPPPAGGGQRTHARVEPKKVIKKPDTVVQTDKHVETPPESSKPEPDPAPGGQVGGVVGGVQGGTVGGTVGGTLGGTLGNPLTPTSSVLPFGPGMNRPSLLSQTSPKYSREAAAAKVSGLMLVKCVITLSGSLRNCRIVKGLPFMDQAVLAALSTWQYSPIVYQGHPVSVEYVIPVRLVAP